MEDGKTEPPGPDLTKGIAASDLPDGGKLLGHVGDEHVLLARRGAEIFAIGAVCTHYSGPLAEGLMVDDTIRCPWHHACFSLRTGEALHAPALSPVDSWLVDQKDGKILVREKRAVTSAPAPRRSGEPGRIVIVGGGAAGLAAAEMLRRRKYEGQIVMLSADDSPPVDRPNLSKDYLAGSASEDWLPLRPAEFYRDNVIELRLQATVERLDPASREVTLAGGESVPFDRLLLATGAEPVRASIPGTSPSEIFVLRSLADCRAIIERAKTAKTVLVLGASFIGLEVAAALRAREIEVHVAAPETTPMERILGHEMGEFVRALHEQHGVRFHLGATAIGVEGAGSSPFEWNRDQGRFHCRRSWRAPACRACRSGRPQSGSGRRCRRLSRDERAGNLRRGRYRALARSISGEAIRVEHWVVAERQGQIAALNLMGERTPFAAAPFFWSQHYDIPINYVGHAERWDEIAVEGDIAAKDCLVRYKRAGRTLAVASIFRDVAKPRS